MIKLKNQFQKNLNSHKADKLLQKCLRIARKYITEVNFDDDQT